MQDIIVSTIEISNNLINTLCENNCRKTLLPNGNEWKWISKFSDLKTRNRPISKKLTIFIWRIFVCAQFKHLIRLFPCSRLEKRFDNFICCRIFFRGSPWCNVLANSLFTLRWPGDKPPKIMYQRTRNYNFYKSIMFCNYLYQI